MMSLFHDDVLSLHRPAGIATVQGTLALADPPVVLAARRPRRQPTPATDRLEHWARRYCQVAVDIVTGDRPASQVLRWSSPEVFGELSERAALVARAGGPGSARRAAAGGPRRVLLRPKVVSVRICYLTPDIAEVSAHVRHGHRSRALALRFERTEGRWLCVVLQFAPIPPDDPATDADS